MTPEDLTDRERQVCRLVALGLTYPDIGDRLGISDRTVEVYVYRVARRLPGETPPRSKIMRWWMLVAEEAESP